MEIFSGTGRLTAALNARGIVCDGLDTSVGVDLLDPRIERRVCDLVRGRRVAVLWFGLDGPTLRVSRGRRAVRSAECPEGIQGLPSRLRRMVCHDNALVDLTVRLAQLAEKYGVAWVIEVPARSLALWSPRLRRLVAQTDAATTVLDFCMYGCASQRRTKLVASGVDLHAVARRCDGRGGRCSASGHRHLRGDGRGQTGARRQHPRPYPLELAARVADVLYRHLR